MYFKITYLRYYFYWNYQNVHLRMHTQTLALDWISHHKTRIPYGRLYLLFIKTGLIISFLVSSEALSHQDSRFLWTPERYLEQDCHHCSHLLSALICRLASTLHSKPLSTLHASYSEVCSLSLSMANYKSKVC